MVITLEVFLKICVGFSSACVAGGWLIKIIKAAKKPTDEMTKKLNNDNSRIEKIEADMMHLTDAVAVLMRCDLAMLGHMRTNNNTGQLASVEKEIQDFLIQGGHQ